MGRSAAEVVRSRIRQLSKTHSAVRMVFAAAPSQHEFLQALTSFPDINWQGVTAFHMDEYIGLPENAAQKFGNFLRRHLFEKVDFGAVHYMHGNAADIEAECRRYTGFLRQAPIDIACMGIGENGHLAFNDPPVADFDDPQTVKIVELDKTCRQQQVNDGCFDKLEDVPHKAMTLTIPALLQARFVSVVVPGSSKRDAVTRALQGEISSACPASILRHHEDAILHLDSESAGAC